MKKILLMTVVCCMLLSSFTAFAAAENIIINGENVTIPAEMGKVVEKDDRTFVPIRFVTEYLGCVVNYQEAQNSATITNPATGTSYFLMSGDNKIYVLPSQGSAPIVVMDTTTFINNEEGRMYVPVRFLAEALDYTVDWEEATQTVILNSNTDKGLTADESK